MHFLRKKSSSRLPEPFVAGILALVLSIPGSLAAQGLARVQSCAEASALLSAYNACVATLGASCTLPKPSTQVCWDFENGVMWPGVTGTAFSTQPTFGDNVKASRVLQADVIQPGQSRTRDADLKAIGGDYWNVPYPIGHQGNYWVGTFENRPIDEFGSTACGRAGNRCQPWGTTQGDGPTGRAISPEFQVGRNWMDFLVGGGCDQNYVHVRLEYKFKTSWYQAYDANNQILKAAGECKEQMRRVLWWVGGSLWGKTARFVIQDQGGGSWGHINVDHIRLHDGGIDEEPDSGPLNKNRPLWGFADLHTHPGQEVAFKASGPSPNGRIFWGRNGVANSTAAQYAQALPDCDGTGHGTNHQGGPVGIAMLETASLGKSPDMPDTWNGAQYNFWAPVQAGFGKSDDTLYGRERHPGGGYLSNVALPNGRNNSSTPPNGKNLRGYPYWWTRGHQQMHVDWIRRAYQGGLRLMVAAAGNAEPLGAFVRDHHDGSYVSDYGAMRLFAQHMKGLASANAAWMEIAYTPWDSHRIISSNKLAIVLATEIDDLGDHCSGELEPGGASPLDTNSTVATVFPNGLSRNQIQDRAAAASCNDTVGWEERVRSLYDVGYRLITPIHMADNALGGAAVYTDLQTPLNRFKRGSFFGLTDTGELRAKLDRHVKEMGWCFGVGCTFGAPLDVDTPFQMNAGPMSYSAYPRNLPVGNPGCDGEPGCVESSAGHRNMRGLTSQGVLVLNELMKRGMLIDVSHMSIAVRNKVLGRGGFESTSVINPGCNFNSAASRCHENAYPLLATHPGYRELSLDPVSKNFDGLGDEGGLATGEIGRIRDVGGMIGVGTAPSDVRGVDLAYPGSGGPYTGIRASTVANRCGGSTRTFAQTYIYALRQMNRAPSVATNPIDLIGGIALGTDFNGLEARLNPRYGTGACYGRGNIPWAYLTTWDGSPLVNTQSPVPLKYNRRIMAEERGRAGEGYSMGATASKQARTQALSHPMLRYTFHGDLTTYPTVYMQLPANYLENMLNMNWSAVPAGAAGLPVPATARISTGIPPLVAQRTGTRTFDYNTQGLAQYGMLPDMLQDARTIGMSREQLGPLFRSANAFVQTWLKACSVSTSRNPGAQFNAKACARPAGY